MSKICTGQSTRRVSGFMANYSHSPKSWETAVSNSVLKLQLHCSGSYRSEFQDKCLFVYLLSVEKYFRPLPTNQTFSVFVSKVQDEQGILLFVHRKLSWESKVLDARSGSLFEILGAHGLIVSASGADQAALRTRMLGVRSFLRASRPIGSNDGDDEDYKEQFIAISL